MSDLQQSVTEWTSDGWHKVCGTFTFHPHLSYQMRDKKDKHGIPIWGVKVPDLENSWWDPQLEFAYDIWTSILVSKGAVNQRGEHTVGLFVAVYTQEQWDQKVAMSVTPVAKFNTTQSPSHSYHGTFPMGVKLECDSGKYYVEWSISRISNDGTRDRQGDGGPHGLIVWDSDAAREKREVAINQNVYG
ncbi:hypothetical protein [Kitasatospora griseola]|uniref:hypothetical protein n=1 Tax=Kitasatospora griseola TaxID=2064 RepID=UPI00343D9BA9